MGPRSFPGKVIAYAGVHALHVRWRCSNLQHGHRLHAAFDSVQEHGVYEYRYVNVNASTSWRADEKCSVRPIRASVQHEPQILHDTVASKSGIYCVELSHTDVGSLEMSVDGIVTHRNGGLAGV